MTYGYCVYHELECDYSGRCQNCPHNTVADTKWFEQEEEKELVKIPKTTQINN